MTSDVHIGLRVPAELEQAIRLLGEQEDRSFSAEVRRALWRHIELEALISDDERGATPAATAAGEPRP